MTPRKPRLADPRRTPDPQPVTVTRTAARPAARAAALALLGDGDPRRLVTEPDGSVLIVNRPPGIRRAGT